jgi:hypothetical protein
VKTPLFERLLKEVERICGNEASHGVDHAGRTLDFALRIGKVEGGDISVIGAAALLHDIGRENIFSDPGHGARGAKMAEKILRKLDADVDVKKVVDIIARHDEPEDSDGEVRPRELAILRDADRLELLRISPDYLDLTRLVTDEALRLVSYALSVHYPDPGKEQELLSAMERTKAGAEEILEARGRER